LSRSIEPGHANDGSNHYAGVHSLAEIVSQPDCWNACLKNLRQDRVLEKVCERFGDPAEWLFVGCGSSYYVALCAAATTTAWTGLRARAVPASEVLLYPDLVVPASGTCVPVLISRSGQTSEVLKAAELFKARSIPTLAISCAEAQALEKLASLTITLPAADEKSTVMTRSFTSMLLTLQSLASLLGKKSEDSDALGNISEVTKRALQTLPDRIRAFAANHQFADYVCLGQGPFYGLACEYALKVTEMSVSYAQAFHTLEFRHGPKSIVGPETLLVFLLSERGYAAESDVLEEMKSLGGTTMVVANRASERVTAAADILVELSVDGPELVQLAPSLVPGQLLGLYTGLKKGLDPDSPRNLSRAVVLGDSSPKKPEHAAF
jgi:glucosamine--fructose-6-phosphate aminotransferase (isomerizing)